MKYYYDLHIHTALSACADLLMTPNNLLNMASLKGLQVISFTDHNSVKQLPVIFEIAKSYNMVVIPGIEVSLSDNLHYLCYFRKLEDAITFGNVIEHLIPKTPYESSLHGEQHITDEEDIVVECYPYLLSAPLPITYELLRSMLAPFQHKIVLAHVNRYEQKAIEFLKKSTLDGIEFGKETPVEFIKKEVWRNYQHYFNSDAHQLTDLLEPSFSNQMILDDLSIDSFFKRKHYE
jgi:PHP family Zn ribbon phosphoesterase